MTRAGTAPLAFLLALAFTAVVQVRAVDDWETTSFAGYWAVARAVADGQPVVQLYDDEALQARIHAEGLSVREHFLGPPTLALTMRPLASLSYTSARRVWLWSVALPSLAGGLWLLVRSAGGGPLVILAAATFLLGAPAWHGLRVGQVYGPFLLLHALALGSASSGRFGRAGLLLSPMLASRGWYGLLLAIGLALSHRDGWRSLVGAFGGAALIALGTLPVVGPEAWRYFLRVQLPAFSTNPWAGTPAYQTLRSLLVHLTTPSPLWGPDPPLPAPGVALPVTLALGALLVLLATVVSLRARLRGGRIAGPFALWTGLSLLLAPVAEDYHFVLAAVPAAVLLGAPDLRGRALAMIAIPLVVLDLDHLDVTRWGGWRSLLSYPRVWGMLALTVAGLISSGPSLSSKRRTTAAPGAGGASWSPGASSPPRRRR